MLPVTALEADIPEGPDSRSLGAASASPGIVSPGPPSPSPDSRKNNSEDGALGTELQVVSSSTLRSLRWWPDSISEYRGSQVSGT